MGKCYSHLSAIEREEISRGVALGYPMQSIARQLGRSACTVSRELRRNTLNHDKGIYDGDLAHARARQRSRRPRRSRLLVDEQLRMEVQAKLLLEWSPEQIAGHLREEFLTDRSGICATRPSIKPFTRATRV